MYTHFAAINYYLLFAYKVINYNISFRRERLKKISQVARTVGKLD